MNDALPTLWVNGERQSSSRHVSACDRGLTLADGVFETMRAYRGTVFRLDRHLARLVHGLTMLDIPVLPELGEWVRAAVCAGGNVDVAVRLTVTRGAGMAGVAPPAHSQPTAIVAVNPPPLFPEEIYRVGLTAHVASGRRNEYSMTAGLKTIAYTDSVAAWLEARRAGAEEALFLDTQGHCSEAISSNLFLWTGSELATPPISCGALPGITRATVFELASTLGVPAAERLVAIEDLFRAEEAFLTSSLRGLAPLVRLDARPIGRGIPGVMTRTFAEAYAALVARECGGS